MKLNAPKKALVKKKALIPLPLKKKAASVPKKPLTKITPKPKARPIKPAPKAKAPPVKVLEAAAKSLLPEFEVVVTFGEEFVFSSSERSAPSLQHAISVFDRIKARFTHPHRVRLFHYDQVLEDTNPAEDKVIRS